MQREGTIIPVAEASQGVGKFGRWLQKAGSPEEVMERFREEGYTSDGLAKAYMFA